MNSDFSSILELVQISHQAAAAARPTMSISVLQHTVPAFATQGLKSHKLPDQLDLGQLLLARVRRDLALLGVEGIVEPGQLGW